jgi:hypothetical protein
LGSTASPNSPNPVSCKPKFRPILSQFLFYADVPCVISCNCVSVGIKGVSCNSPIRVRTPELELLVLNLAQQLGIRLTRP